MTTISSKAICGMAAALLLAGCSGGTTTNNSANLSGANMMSEPMLGNDASAMETIANQPAPMDMMPPASSPSNRSGNSSGNSSAPEPAETGSGGGDRGGNTVQSNVSGM